MVSGRLIVVVSLLVVPMALVAAVPAAGQDGVECDPAPIGRCGEFQREQINFCYVKQGDSYLPFTDKNVVAVGGDAVLSVGTDDKGDLYVRLTPYQKFAANPSGAPAPQKTIWQEDNNVKGLQWRPFACATFIWFAECDPQQWMGPFNEVARPADVLLT